MAPRDRLGPALARGGDPASGGSWRTWFARYIQGPDSHQRLFRAHTAICVWRAAYPVSANKRDGTNAQAWSPQAQQSRARAACCIQLEHAVTLTARHCTLAVRQHPPGERSQRRCVARRHATHRAAYRREVLSAPLQAVLASSERKGTTVSRLGVEVHGRGHHNMTWVGYNSIAPQPGSLCSPGLVNKRRPSLTGHPRRPSQAVAAGFAACGARRAPSTMAWVAAWACAFGAFVRAASPEVPRLPRREGGGGGEGGGADG